MNASFTQLWQIMIVQRRCKRIEKGLFSLAVESAAKSSVILSSIISSAVRLTDLGNVEAG